MASARSTCDGAWHIDDPAVPRSSASAIDPEAPDDVWAVGGTFNARLRFHPLIRHRDAVGWSTLPAVDPAAARSAELSAVDASAPDNAWAIGFGLTGPPLHPSFLSFAERWNGSTWSLVPLPSSSSVEILTDVADVAPDDAWIVGVAAPHLSGNRAHAVLLRWQGASWSRVDLPFTDRWAATVLTAVQAVATNDVWIAGYYVVDRRGPALPLIAHWDGTTWSQASIPQPRPGKSWTLNDLAAIGGEIWGVGGTGRNLLARGPLVLRWDGSTWTSSTLPGVTQSSISSVAGTSGSDVWATLSSNNGPGAIHWDGTAWTVSNPAVEAGLPIGSTYPREIATDGSGGVWFTGWNQSLSSFTLHRC